MLATDARALSDDRPRSGRLGRWRRLGAVASVLVTAVTVPVIASTEAQAAAGPRALSTAGFSIKADYRYKADLNAALASKLAATRLHTVMLSANHKRVPITDRLGLRGPVTGFRFDNGDNSTCLSYPQGITTSRDAVGGANGGNYDGHQVVMVSWYTKNTCGGSGTRSWVSVVDWDATYPNTYRKILLVEPTGTVAKPSFTDVNVHAGGIVWYGNYLYLADTTHGMRVFDMRKILKVRTDGSAASIGLTSKGYQAHNFAYVLPQVGKITDTSSTDILWSTISLDRASKSLVVSEFTCTTHSAGACANAPLRGARAARFPFAKNSSTFAPTTRASQALQTGYHWINGVASHNNRWWFASSGTNSLYYWTSRTGQHTYPWVTGAESISYWEDATKPDQLVTVQERIGHRNVVFVEQYRYS